MGWTATTPRGTMPHAVDLTVVPDAWCSRFDLDKTQVPYRATGAVHRGDGSLVRPSQRVGGRSGDRVVSADPETVDVAADVEQVPGTWLYGGTWMGQFGHFITETLTTLWPLLPGGRPVAGLLFHRFIFSSELQPYQQELLRLLGAADLPVRVVDQPLRVEELLVPARPFVLNVAAAPQAVQVWRHVARDVDAGSGRSVYLSRSRLPEDPRRLPGDAEVDQVMAEAGFLVVHPEQLAVAEQIRVARSAAVLAGMSGSALHLSAFAGPGTAVLEIGDPRTETDPLPNQQVIDSACGRRGAFVPLLLTPDGGRDVAATAAAVRELVGS